MKISYEWIRTYVPTKVRAKKLADCLTMNGLEVTAIEEKQGDFIFEIEIMPNRPDTLSHIGVAREISAITGKTLKLPVVNLGKYFKAGLPIPQVIIKDKRECPTYTARIIADINVAPSPKWLIKRLEAIGLRPVNNIVDITNFVLLETGQPLHAFDYDKLSNGAIIVRLAKEGEEITTIDGEKRKLKSSTLVIADPKKPVAIAGIMGGLDTEVGASTKRILLESAYFDPISIRRSSRYLGLSSDSSYRFERGVDPSGIVSASDRAAALICEVAKGKTAKKIVYVGKKQAQATSINVRALRVSKVLGAKISNASIKSALASLGLKTQGQGARIKVTVPSFREDVKREIDVIEEIVRIRGYDNMPSVLPNAIITDEDAGFKEKARATDTTRNTLIGLGFNEIMTYSLISREDLKKVNMPDVNTISIRNPLSDQQAIMRNTLLYGALKSINNNINMGNKDIRQFELSNVYFKQAENLQEALNLTLAICGSRPSDWSRKPEKIDLFFLKGIVKALLNRLSINVYFEESQHPSLEQGCTMAILVDNNMLGIMGLVKAEVLAGMSIKTDVYAAEINMPAVFENCRLEKSFTPFARFPKSERDISICIDNGVLFKDINNSIKAAASPIIKNIELVEEYKGKQIPDGQKGISVKITYQSKDRTLKEEEIEQAHNVIRDCLVKEFKAVLR